MRVFRSPPLLGALLAAPFLSAVSAIAGPLTVGIDMAAPVHLDRPAASVVIGNPAIADVQIESPTLVFLQGRSYGTTNLIALDRDGREILQASVTVTSAKRLDVTLERGIGGRITYACSGRCEPSAMPGDEPGLAKSVLDMATAKSGAADQVAKGN
jgi:hypothetical protein